MCNIYIITKYEALFSEQVVKVLLKFCFSLISDQIIFHHLSVSNHGSQVSQSHFWCSGLAIVRHSLSNNKWAKLIHFYVAYGQATYAQASGFSLRRF